MRFEGGLVGEGSEASADTGAAGRLFRALAHARVPPTRVAFVTVNHDNIYHKQPRLSI
jgi:hypothetical protein